MQKDIFGAREYIRGRVDMMIEIQKLIQSYPQDMPADDVLNDIFMHLDHQAAEESDMMEEIE